MKQFPRLVPNILSYVNAQKEVPGCFRRIFSQVRISNFQPAS